jgi:hypothetical protein
MYSLGSKGSLSDSNAAPYGGKDDSAQTRDDVPSNTVFGDNARGFRGTAGFGDYSMKDVNSMSELEHACVLLEMELFGKIPKSDVMGYGIGDNELRVYLFDDGHTTKVPKNFMGFPVKVEVTGDIVAI